MVVALGLLAGSLGLGLVSWLGCRVLQVNQTTIPDRYETVLNNKLDVVPDSYASSDAVVSGGHSVVEGVSVPETADDMIASKFEDEDSGLVAGVVAGEVPLVDSVSPRFDSGEDSGSKAQTGFWPLFLSFLFRIWWILLLLLIFVVYKILRRKKR